MAPRSTAMSRIASWPRRRRRSKRGRHERAKRANLEHSAVRVPKGAPMSERDDGVAPSEERDIVLEAEEIVAGYVPEVNILSGTNLTLYDGELVGIIGPNGAGKSN